MDMQAKELADEVKSLAKLYGVTISELAEEMNMNYEALRSRLRRGIVSCERDSFVKAIGRINDYHAEEEEKGV